MSEILSLERAQLESARAGFREICEAVREWRKPGADSAAALGIIYNLALKRLISVMPEGTRLDHYP